MEFWKIRILKMKNYFGKLNFGTKKNEKLKWKCGCTHMKVGWKKFKWRKLCEREKKIIKN